MEENCEYGRQIVPNNPYMDKKSGWAADMFNFPFKLKDSLKLIS